MGANRLSGPATVSRNLWEPILWYGKYPPNQITRDLIYAEIGVGFNEHPCPKPVKLLSQLLAAGTRSNEIVLDPFMGSGTTLVAAKERQQKAIGIEIEEKYCETAAKRLAQEVLPFGRPVPKACLSTVQSEFIT